jgi:hypothetical protein
MKGENHSIEPEIGDQVRHIFKDNSCRVIATKTNPHKQRFGNEEIDKEGHERPVPEGFDLTIVEETPDFRPYIDVKFSEIR